MAMKISKKQISLGNTNYYSKGFRNMIENYLPVLKKLNSTIAIPIRDIDRYRFVGDLYALLIDLNQPQDLFWIIMRLNDMHSPMDFNKDIRELLIPSKSVLDVELQKFITVTL
jgi:hypothetical protein